MLVATARRRAAGEFALLGYPPQLLTRPIEWDVDHRAGSRWPRRHGLMTDYRYHPVGDPKWVWELNRLQHIPLLLAAWLVAEDDSLAESAIADLLGWIAADSPGQGIAWANAFEPGLRAMSMALALDALRSDGCRLTRCYRPVAESLSRHVAWIERFPSLHSSANNHRLGELCGVIVADALVPELSIPVQLERALDELRLRCAEQFAPDGGNREQAFGYAVFATDMLLLAASSLSAAGRNVPRWLSDTLRRSGRALELQLGGDDDPEPRYGDCDDGRCADLDGLPRRTARTLCDALAARSGDDRIARCARSCATTVWLTGSVSQPAARRAQGKAGCYPRVDLLFSGARVLRSCSTAARTDSVRFMRTGMRTPSTLGSPTQAWKSSVIRGQGATTARRGSGTRSAVPRSMPPLQWTDATKVRSQGRSCGRASPVRRSTRWTSSGVGRPHPTTDTSGSLRESCTTGAFTWSKTAWSRSAIR